MARTDDAERVAAYIAQEPLLSESIYLGPKYNKQRREKEVADLLLVHRNRAIVIQIKCQQDPEARSGDKLRNWVESRAREGCNQLRGTLNTLRDREFWCDHPTFKRVNFPKNQLTPIHGIVLVEHRIRGLSLPRTLPTEINSIPVTYLTLSDFLNHISEFRTFVDLCEFLHARHDLKDFDHHLTGREDVLRAHYFLNNGSFPVGLSQQQRLSEFYTRRSDFERFWLQKQIGDDECKETEAAARSLRRRAAGYPPRNPDDKHYRTMQSALMDLTYAERRLVGRKIRQSISTVSTNKAVEPFTSTNIVISNSDLIIMITASQGLRPAGAQSILSHLLEEFSLYVNGQNLLWINVRENSPKYQFVYVAGETLSAPPEHIASPDELPPEWITYTPEARF